MPEVLAVRRPESCESVVSIQLGRAKLLAAPVA